MATDEKGRTKRTMQWLNDERIRDWGQEKKNIVLDNEANVRYNWECLRVCNPRSLRLFVHDDRKRASIVR